MAVVHATNENFEEEVMKSPVTTVVDFWATWCGPCRMIAPILEEIADEKGDALKVVKINVDEEEELASRYGIVSIPTLLIFRDGEIDERLVGYRPKDELLAHLD